MSLVLEALRRVEKSSARPGSVGVAVTSYRSDHRRRSALVPLLLGLGTGAILVFLWRPQGQTAPPPLAGVMHESGASRPSALPAQPLAAMVPQSLSVPSRLSAAPTTTASPPPSRPGTSSPVSARTSSETSEVVIRPVLILQAISERDSRPVAVINDQLVREGDLFEGARILRIGPESVDVLLESGKEDIVRFAPPPPAESLPTPESR